MKKVVKRKIKGFTLAELLAVIAILSVVLTFGITTTYMLIDRAKQSKINSDKNTISVAAQSYAQNNKSIMPKKIGESIHIKISDLRSSNYLTEDIESSSGESCMENSYVRVYKLSSTEYIYTAFLYCGREKVPESENIPKPLITGKFLDSTGKNKEENLKNINTAYMNIEMNAAKPKEIEDYKQQKNDIKLESYSYKIHIEKNKILYEAYNSGSLSAERKEKIIINKRISELIDVSGITEISLEVTAVNTLGGMTTIHAAINEKGIVDKVTTKDNIRPKCIKQQDNYDENDWINKQKYENTKEVRKFTVGCDDYEGSGCIKDSFTKTFPNNTNKYGAEYAYIEVKDNAGNVSLNDENCKIRVNVDIKTPKATVTAYVGEESKINESSILEQKIKGENILKEEIQVDDTHVEEHIEPTKKYYKKLVGYETEDKWMNNKNFPNGVIYKIELEDNIRLDKWTWKTNEGYISSIKDNNYLVVNENNPEATEGFVPQNLEHGKNELHGSTIETVYVRFLTEGMRYGEFTAYDKAGNSVKIKIAANIDRTAPPIPENLNAYVYDKVGESGKKVSNINYSFQTWTNRFVRVETTPNQNRDDLINNTTLAGFWKYYYDARNNENINVGEKDSSSYTSGIGIYDFKGTSNEIDGKNKIRFKACDKANNCSNYGKYQEVWIDTTPPKCNVTKEVINGEESSYGWLGINEIARVIATCEDNENNSSSGCVKDSFYHDYNYQIKTTTAGANGNNDGGIFYDNAGNTVKCGATETVNIDYEKPKCTVSGGNKNWTNDKVKITGTCSDTGGSGCQGNISYTYKFDIETSTAGANGNNDGGIVLDKADNYVICQANQTVLIDKTAPYIEWTPKQTVFNYNENINNEKETVNAICKDDLSGFEDTYPINYTGSFQIPTTKSGKTHEKCCQDLAGNSYCEAKTYYATYFNEDPSCGIKKYKECTNEKCGIETYNTCKIKECGINSYEWTCSSDLKGKKTFKINSLEHPYGGKGYCGITKTIYKSCENSKCGIATYKKCRTKECGVEEYNNCYHYKSNNN